MSTVAAPAMCPKHKEQELIAGCCPLCLFDEVYPIKGSIELYVRGMREGFGGMSGKPQLEEMVRNECYDNAASYYQGWVTGHNLYLNSNQFEHERFIREAVDAVEAFVRERWHVTVTKDELVELWNTLNAIPRPTLKEY